MGRIVVYTTTGCPHSVRACLILKSHKILYNEVNIQLFPLGVDDMWNLCHEKFVPQIFFNEKHIGVQKTKFLFFI